jgi:biotin operon repressor
MTPMKRKLLINDVENIIKSLEEAWGVEISKVGAKFYNSYKAHK